MPMGSGSEVMSWGRLPFVSHAGIHAQHYTSDPWPDLQGTVLPFGNGRSYGDSCLNESGYLLATTGMDRFIEFDRQEGRLRCESGILLRSVLAVIVDSGWFLPVTPGTQFVTIGGAIANDVHGKNHHSAGSFGNHIICFELLRSDGERLLCSRESNADIFAATIGGLGLTGLITWVEIQLKKIGNPYVRVESLGFDSLNDFFRLAAASDQEYEYTVAWIDCLASGNRLGRGVFFRGNHAETLDGKKPSQKSLKWAVPFDPPFSLVGKNTLRLLNQAYRRRQLAFKGEKLQHFEPFFYPLDGINQWNRVYGPKGFYQFQSVVPPDVALQVTRNMLTTIARSGQGSFLSVLKVFGARPSVGMLSFPRPGVTLALDFPSRGSVTLRLLDKLEELVINACGAIYPAKDARMSSTAFRLGFPRAAEFAKFIDPGCSSSFWRRVWEDPT